MSDKKNVTDGDQAATDKDKPMEDPEVRVRVRPVRHKTKRNMPREQRQKAGRQNDENRELADKIEKNLEKEIERKVKDAGEKPGATRQDQYDAADKAAEDAASQTSRRKINKIDYAVGDSDGFHHEEVEPKEGAPPDDEE